MLGKGSTSATTPVSRTSEKEKPPRFELPEYMRDDLNVKTDKSDSAPKRDTLNNKDIEEFLFSMLGEGFKLSMEVIREVLGSCGYDIKKNATVERFSSKGSCLESQSTFSNGSADSLQGKRNSSSQISPGELLESIFTVPERSDEEPIGKRYELGANRNGVPDQKPVVLPLEDISSHSTDFPVKAFLVNKEPIADNEDQNYRRTAKQHWDMMKQYYEKAADAFREGNQKEIEYLLGEGKQYYRMARLADEKSSGKIVKSKKVESKNDLCLDLRGQDPANVANLVMKYLEKKSIVWSEDEASPGTILIPINQPQDQQA
ncbi:hypothetical protein E2562_033290 [Oryza meyeriana var. granulata]|uniref:DUF1771 domain-containing protein n=1 Tax=Oryza meyeriana var. granulata TaxID=110450 RepID=A0A6G1CW49_9ORYZ|nr:hypothetical protein E2562_033290 [Oryza meyeriana var. granulata]